MAKHVKSMNNPRSTSDLITHLPGDLTDNILMRLPLREAVKTSALSKKWRYKWITIPDLVFDSFASLTSKGKRLTGSEILQIIYQVLLQHREAISKFKLTISELGSCLEINILISFLTKDESLKEFTLDTGKETRYKIPSSLFYGLQIRFLSLSTCSLKPPPDFAGFSQLTEIDFYNVLLLDNFSENVVSRCPLLERLSLFYCSNIDCISFFAPNLKLLMYNGSFRSVSFKHTPALESVSLSNDFISEFSEAWDGNTCLQNFSDLSCVEYLYIRFPSMPLYISKKYRLSYSQLILPMGIVPNSLASHLTCLVILDICLTYLGDARFPSCILCLMRSSPNLQSLTIRLDAGKTVDDRVAAEVFLEAKGSMRSLEELRTVDLFKFKSLTSVMELLKLLLAKSPVLETMHLHGFSLLTADEKCTVLQQINGLRRA